MQSGSVAKMEEIKIDMISPTDTPVTITLNSKPYDLTLKSCRICEYMPTQRLIELTLDLIFKHRTYDEIIELYTPFLRGDNITPISDWTLRHHKEHSSFTKLSDEDQKQLTINHRQLQATEKALKKLNGEFRLDTAQLDMIKENIQSLTTYQDILASQQDELAQLESGILPDNMKDTHQIVDETTGKVVTNPLRPLIEKARKQVLATQGNVNETRLKLALAMQNITKGTGNQAVALAVDEAYTHIQVLKSALGSFFEHGMKFLQDVAPDHPTLPARWNSDTDRYFQQNLVDPITKIQSLLRALITEK